MSPNRLKAKSMTNFRKRPANPSHPTRGASESAAGAMNAASVETVEIVTSGANVSAATDARTIVAAKIKTPQARNQSRACGASSLQETRDGKDSEATETSEACPIAYLHRLS